MESQKDLDSFQQNYTPEKYIDIYIERVKDTHRQRIITYNHNQLKDIYIYIYIYIICSNSY